MTRRLEDLPTGGGDERLQHMEQTILKPKNLPPELQSLRAAALWLNGITGRPPKLPIIAIGDRDLFLEV